MVDLVQIGNVDKACAFQQWAGDWIFGTSISVAQPTGKGLRGRTDRHRTKVFAVEELQAAGDDPTEGVRLFQNCVEHGGEVAGRGIDDLQDLSGRGLPLERLVSLGLALGKFSLTVGKLTLQIGYELLGIG